MGEGVKGGECIYEIKNHGAQEVRVLLEVGMHAED